ncbi:2-oxoglutarate ferredoxin oxidoreductase subunit alpha [Caldalkalibacillus uzonensis]|uniref:2-oxoglutarate ferredoxin oxidoreductase subunit alpha n=1 Tax=Caldalkalibacillus uzonensis TaxID=353224 RepID=A0ABU0CWE4_9BACI|nr:2-oxoacid:acceptor oxidoreductase subunit alpha [Caldalkalibacillus uzonensis]MDQ0340700.1 2-oxoglutarate ferredoxin oxidoreductase subunit alpha [Caldalkalibacillus uzonensis]
MKTEITFKIGGQQGEGIDSTGEVLAVTLMQQGYQIASYKHFASRIKGGHTYYHIRASCDKVYYWGDTTDILVALDQESYEHNISAMSAGGYVLMATNQEEKVAEADGCTVLYVNFTRLAEELGNKIIRNMVALGAAAYLMGLHYELFKPLVEKKFLRKGQALVDLNISALKAGYEHVQQLGLSPFQLAPVQSQDQALLSGNEAFAFGAIAAGCRFLSAYPITPASEIMEYMKSHLPKVGGVAVQAEDELAGILMAIGAGYAGVRALTSTSGPGFSLKTEAIGLAGISETPVVIVNSQRGGPGTGLPTKYEQGDLNTMLYAGHGDIPRIVLAPSTVEECLTMASLAFNLAERYQCPVIVALDLVLSLNKQTCPDFRAEHFEPIDRGKLLSEAELEALGEFHFKRYRLTEDGISPRAIPGQRGGVHPANSNEHSETGHITELPEMRQAMMNKRLGKLTQFKMRGYEFIGGEERSVQTLFVGFGSTRGVLTEVVKDLQDQGEDAGLAHIKVLYPFQAEGLSELARQAEKIVVVENNWSGQLAGLLAKELQIGHKIHKICKADGDPFTKADIMQHYHQLVKEVV